MPSPSSPVPNPEAEASYRLAAWGQLQPFGDDICATWREAETSVPMHEGELEELRTLEAEGRVVLLSAPRAGHGKTHLLGRVAQKLRGEAIVAGLPWQSMDGLGWEATGRGALLDLSHGEAPAPLQLMCAGTLATLLRRLIQTGKIPSTDPSQALRVLGQDPMELFHEQGSARVIGEWFCKHFEQLRRPLAEISNVDSTDMAEDWLQAMFDYVQEPSPTVRESLLSRFDEDGSNQAVRFFRLASAWKPVVLVADHMDALYRDPEAGLKVARMSLALAALPGVRVVLSMNQDLWDTTFGRQLPSALEDRLSARSVSLHGLGLEEARTLVALRLTEAGVDGPDLVSFLKFLDLDHFFLGRASGSTAARHLLRHAAQRWRTWLHEPLARDADSKGTTQEAPGHHPSSVPPHPLPILEAFEEENGEDLELLARSLAEDTKGIHVDLSNHVIPPQAPPPFHPVPLPEEEAEAEPEPESFLLDDDEDDNDDAGGDGNADPRTGPMAEEEQRVHAESLQHAHSSYSNGITNSEHSPQPASPWGQAATPPMTMGDLQGRFEFLRKDAAFTGKAMHLDLPALGELIRLAGKRFPVVNYDDVEVPGLQGRALPRWSLPGMELLFGLEEYTETHYWRTVVSFVVGRLAEVRAHSAQTGDPMPDLRLVAFKDDPEGTGVMNLLRQEIIPATLRTKVDAIHLDTRTLASIQALHTLVRDMETGSLRTDPNLLVSLVAQELDPLWKRLTRVMR